MSIPADARIKWELLYLLHNAPDDGLDVKDVYRSLAVKFPELTTEELTVPFKSDRYGSKWNTAVRSVREKCKKEGLISQMPSRGYWALTDEGHRVVTEPLIIPELD
ncbi:MAG TPA: winged helix-turn-helix domain-containing protein [Nitrosospira sp.]